MNQFHRSSTQHFSIQGWSHYIKRSRWRSEPLIKSISFFLVVPNGTPILMYLENHLTTTLFTLSINIGHRQPERLCSRILILETVTTCRSIVVRREKIQTNG